MNVNNMKNTYFEKQTDKMRPEYDFCDGFPNKYAKQLRENGCIIRVFQPDGSFTERRVLGEKTIVLDADV